MLFRTAGALLILALCALAAADGIEIIRFSISRTGDTRAVSGIGLDAGLTTAALEFELNRTAVAADPETTNRRLELLEALLGAAPLSSESWLSLAGMRLAAGRPTEKVLAALAMSSIAGPNEGAVLDQRAILGILRWEALPQDARARVIWDLTGLLLDAPTSPNAVPLAKRALAEKSMPTRAEIAKRLAEARVTGPDLSRLGVPQ